MSTFCKKHLFLVMVVCLLLGSVIGVQAASSKRLRSTGIINYKDGSVVVDGDAIGYWIVGTEDEPIATLTKGNTTLTISDSGLEKNSLVEIYYKESDKDAVSKAGVSYSQDAGSVTITFSKEPKTDIHIISMHVTNPKSADESFSVDES